ncbi:M1 family metallopeptidase [Idiomarina xiamenensis]|uniref:Aminopeptidase N n=1 Tax=Idiomarina xiamenensis 10-D-4 TaxID=740709 RepID=K2LCA4_9GAMM|nr:M1 family metallopeptidase [Idiomarina xiamenensis]EKE87495.1 peptidase M1 membrane alanine aminopeptidase [Idiomarina xiamenensis 10-D-4]
MTSQWWRRVGYAALTFIGLSASAVSYAQDQHSYARLDEISTPHLQLDINLDFAKQQVSGQATYQLQHGDNDRGVLRMDTRDLSIHSVQVELGDNWRDTDFELKAADPVLGSELVIAVPAEATAVRIDYTSAPTASGLQWLTPEQTEGKQKPFMFSQSQAIHARSWIPIQDTPALRLTYKAHVTTRDDLLVVMSAENELPVKRDGDYHFNMPQPIPTYLIAIAAGDLAWQKISDNVAVYAEPAMVEKAAWEFADTPKMIAATEKLYGPYRWDRYDLLILPPSFPFGGMENPRLSFITPTSIAGDRSLVSLIAHELAHSWSGNLVTNASWRDLWLNEGFTSYVENRIMEELYGKERALMEQALAYDDLQEDLHSLPADQTVLNIELGKRNPDDVFSQVPYVKGQLFLMYLEDKFGRERFDQFVRGYFDAFAFQSISTEQFKQYLSRELLVKYPGIVSITEVNQWLHDSGLPADAPHPTSPVFAKVDKQLQDWFAGESLHTDGWTTQHWLYLISQLPSDISLEDMARLDEQFKLTQSANSEIAYAWLRLAIQRDYQTVQPRLRQYLLSIGRNKFVVPLYSELAKTPENLAWARKVYADARPGYHPLTQSKVDQILGKPTKQ